MNTEPETPVKRRRRERSSRQAAALSGPEPRGRAIRGSWKPAISTSKPSRTSWPTPAAGTDARAGFSPSPSTA